MSFVARTSRSSLTKSASIVLGSARASPNPHVSNRTQRHISTSQPAQTAAQGSAPASSATAKEHGGQQAAATQSKQPKTPIPAEVRKKTMAELDEELKLKLEGMSGDGGASGVEYENGQAPGLKRNVKANMFRVI